MCGCEICDETGEAADAARRILHQHLTRYQRRKLHYGSIVIKGGSTGDKYRLDCYAEVVRLSDNHGFCLSVFEKTIEGEYGIPLADQILAKKILIESDETTFLKVANESGE